MINLDRAVEVLQQQDIENDHVCQLIVQQGGEFTSRFRWFYVRGSLRSAGVRSVLASILAAFFSPIPFQFLPV